MLPSEQLCKGRQRQGAHLDTATGVRPSRGTATFELRRDLAKPREPTPTELLRPGTLHLTRILFRRGNRAQTPEGCHVYRLRSQVDCFCFSAPLFLLLERASGIGANDSLGTAKERG